MLRETTALNPRVRFRDAEDLMAKDSRFKAVESSTEREDIYKDFMWEWDEKERKERREKKKAVRVVRAVVCVCVCVRCCVCCVCCYFVFCFVGVSLQSCLAHQLVVVVCVVHSHVPVRI